MESVLGRLIWDAIIYTAHCMLDERLRYKERPGGGGGKGVCGRFGSFRDSVPEIFVVRSFTYSDLNLDRKLFRPEGKNQKTEETQVVCSSKYSS